MALVLLNRSAQAITVEADRDPLFVRLGDNSIRNGYTVKILNRRQTPHTYHLSLDGLPGGRMSVVGYEGISDPSIDVKTDAVRSLKVYVTVPPDEVAKLSDEATTFKILVTDASETATTPHTTIFRRPQP
jgi:polyferredoxin